MSFLQGQSVVQRICVLKKYLIYRDFQEWIENRFPLSKNGRLNPYSELISEL